MRLSDIMGAAGLSGYAEVALILFLAAFVVIMIAIFAPGRKRTYDAASRMPLDDEHPQTPR
ncbi:MAG: cbb3-type cytochrome oxidase subunit 3 [Gemmatimonadaceae bacterium]